MGSLRTLLRALVAAGSAAVLAAGALEIHPAGEHHGLGATELYVCDGPHSRQLHVETAEAQRQPACPICLHRVQTGGVHLPDEAAAQDLPVLGRPAPAAPFATAGADRASLGARAPPQTS